MPPGMHQVTVTRYGKELWPGPITVAADQRVLSGIYVHVSVAGIGLGCDFKMTPDATPDVNDSTLQI